MAVLEWIRSVTRRPKSDQKPRTYADSETGVRPSTQVGRTAAFITLAVLVLGLILAVPQIERLKRFFGDGHLHVTDTTEVLNENADGTCTWVVSFTLENTTDGVLRLRSVSSSVAPESRPQGRFESAKSGLGSEQLEPGATTAGRATFDYDGCPASVDDLSHDGVFVNYSSANAVTGAASSIRTKLVVR